MRRPFGLYRKGPFATGNARFFPARKDQFLFELKYVPYRVFQKKKPSFVPEKKPFLIQKKNRDFKQGFFFLEHPVFSGDEQWGSEIESREDAKKTPRKGDFFIRLKKWCPQDREHTQHVVLVLALFGLTEREIKKWQIWWVRNFGTFHKERKFSLAAKLANPTNKFVFIFVLGEKKRKSKQIFFYRKKGVSIEKN